MKAVKIAILDDETLCIEKIKNVIEDCGDGREISIREYTKSKDLLESDDVYDIILVDMELKEQGRNDEGFEFIREYRARGRDAKMIIVTTHDELARAGYKVKAFDYVFKGELRRELMLALEEAYKELDDGRIVSFTVVEEEIKEPDEIKKIVMLKDIRYFETDGRHIRIHLETEDFLVSSTLVKVMDELMDERFVMAHKSYVVNMKCAVGLATNEIVLSGNVRIPIGRTRKKAVNKSYWEEKRRRK